MNVLMSSEAGDDWDAWVRTYFARVYRRAYRLTGNRQDAEDLAQDVFVRVFRYVSAPTPALLHVITTNLFIDRLRGKHRIRWDQLADNNDEMLASREPPPAQIVEDRIIANDVAAALKGLPPEYRIAVVLRDIEGLSYREIAATLGLKLGTVQSRIYRGRAGLRHALPHRAPRHAGRHAA
ncbi:sigma-70 family RNA polymerase sigma factor [Kribbella sp. NPDC050124]|uniref:sigma-70 family RNA polymerase sigma factor n=1 Tax=Kribbella sp. NPDC050124 TaxID=3364114 RepID=UPI0037AABDAF